MKLKPKTLKVSGLNSFLEEQSIEFDKLTERGLFGIFGPTGSGKSSILDAITLSLYGQTARKSAMYINTETDKLFLSFQFEAGHGERRRRYNVERSMRRTKNGGINTSFVKLIIYDKDGNQERIIEGRTSVENELQDNIIGLNFNDFIRTVVLPQGKFSEFLTLTGAGRNEMLERILGLEDYGERLNRKAKQKRDNISQELNRIQGELSRYDGVSKDEIEALNKGLTDFKENEKLLKIQIKEINDKHEKYSKIWSLQKELANYLGIKEQLKEKHEEYEVKKNNLRKGKNALNVLPHMENMQKALKDIEKSSESLGQYNIEIDKLNSLIEKNKKQYNIALYKKEKEYPILLERKSKVEQAIELLIKKESLDNEINELKTRYSSLENSINIDTKELEKLLSREEKNDSGIEEKEDLISIKSISSEYRQKLNDAKDLEKRYLQLKSDRKNSLVEKNNILKKIDKNNKDLEQIIERLKSVDSSIKELKNKKASLESKKPEDINEISDYQKRALELSSKIEKHEEAKERAEKLKKNQQEILKEKEEFNKKISDLSSELKSKVEKLNRFKKETKELEYKNMAGILREQLIDSEPCPVCGSIHHPAPIVPIGSEKILENQTLIINFENEVNIIEKDLIRLEEEVKSKVNEYNKNQEELHELERFLLQINITSIKEEKKDLEIKFNSAQEYRNNWNKECKILDDKISEIDEEKRALDNNNIMYKTNLDKDKEAFDNINNKLLMTEEEISTVYKEYDAHIKALNITNAANRLKEINKLDEEVENISEELKQQKEQNKKIKIDIQKISEKINKNNEDIKLISQSIMDKRNIVNEFNTNIEQIVGKEEPLNLKKQIEKNIVEIINGEKELKTILDNQNINLNKLNEEKAGLEKAIEALKESSISLKENLNKALAVNDFGSIKEVINSRLEKSVIDSLEKEIELYTNKVKDTDNNITRINNELAGQSITEEEWTAIIESKENVYKEHSKIIEEIGKIKNKIDEMARNLIEVDKLKREIKVQQKKADILSEILDLTKGKRFVEYVSRSHLTYIARVASQRLKEITRERYELEYDSNNNFSIIDNYNGGARRECNSLSGGETFLTSLSLALALSSKIQLKGNTSLEFFFLDEGFGTLDNNLLDVVMTSLERLYNESLSVGIISHVEELKNRVPVKLLVSPAVAGIHGTKVKIEYS